MTSDAGRNEDKSPRYASISGSSAAAALVGGAAALVAQSRPELEAAALKGVLVGTAVPLRATAVAAQGAGFVDPGAASAAEVAARPAAIGFGAADEVGWRSRRTITVENVSTRRLPVTVASEVEGIAGVSVRAKPNRAAARAGRIGDGGARRPSRLPASQCRRRDGSDPSGRGRRRPGEDPLGRRASGARRAAARPDPPLDLELPGLRSRAGRPQRPRRERHGSRRPDSAAAARAARRRALARPGKARPAGPPPRRAPGQLRLRPDRPWAERRRPPAGRATGSACSLFRPTEPTSAASCASRFADIHSPAAFSDRTGGSR